MAALKSFRDLEIWQFGVKLSISIAELAHTLPLSQQYGLAEQMRRSSASVPTNIAEGYGRGSVKELAHYLRIARGSLNELETQLEICLKLGYGETEHIHLLMNSCIRLRVMIARYIYSMKINTTRSP
jgi:four helix bundle protein